MVDAAPPVVAPTVVTPSAVLPRPADLGYLYSEGRHAAPGNTALCPFLLRPRRPKEADAAAALVLAASRPLGTPCAVLNVRLVLAALVVGPAPVLGRRQGQAAQLRPPTCSTDYYFKISAFFTSS